ncbi:hypothetical protein ADIS_2402 [Lunatimonas lonarensis]|uniref:Cytochrome c domain-containing protein n=1 Tax=Lunatimonas lonarensis TaxID=1232681 RepID=R7ZSQ4_9BACT|nr:PVC-type heme-binding CxxCH protein [Lunatimonas lonarensis]EON77092.1 hypothetical protein ADIS_2402 [Lunatimonas lonarensis]
MKSFLVPFFCALALVACNRGVSSEKDAALSVSELTISIDPDGVALQVIRKGESDPILTQVAKDDFRPYLHPLSSPDGISELTEFSPGHHKHQTGIYWGFTRVNGRDYFHNPQADYWRRVALNPIDREGESVSWQTVYDLLDEAGTAILRETQTWTLREEGGEFLLDLVWKGEAIVPVTIGKYDYGGLFVRMPWRDGIDGEVVNAARQKNEKAEGQPAMWVKVGMQLDGRTDYAQIALFDHPANKGYPQRWRVDGQLGVGPAYTRTEDWHIAAGESLQLQHRLLVFTGDKSDMELGEAWSAFSGKSGMYSTTELWGIAQAEGRSAKFLTPEEAVAEMTVKKGYRANVFAAEPMITQPMAFCWDDRGRLWVAENRDYESRGHGFSNAGDSRILILEDTNGDGQADSQKVFMEGIAFPAAIAVGFDGLYLGAPPNLLFVPDKNGDDQADLDDIEILLTGWGIRDRHETLNSLHWGPDGWLYGLQGFATPSKIRKPNADTKLYFHKDPFPEDLLEAEGVDINGGVWRYHPTKDIFEVVAHGFSNPWGIDYDRKGNLFITACVIPHLWHVIPGGIYHRQGGQHFNPYVYEDIKTIADHRHRSAHGGARIYQSDAFPAEEQGRIFMANIHEHAVLSDILVPSGSGFIGKDGDDFLMANNAQWVGFSMEIGPDGGLYVLDWHDADICGQEVLLGETGRIFRVMPEQNQAENWTNRYVDLNTLTDKELVDLQRSKSDWHSRRARGILQKRAYQGKLETATVNLLKQMLAKSDDPDHRLKAMWSLHLTGGFRAEELVNLLRDKDEHIRSWAIQLLCEDKTPPKAALEMFTRLAKSDPSPVVRLYLAQSLQRVPVASQWEIATELIRHQKDEADHNLPKMIWFGISHLIEEDAERFLAMAAQAELSSVARFMARRAVDADMTDKLVAMLEKDPKHRDWILQGMLAGIEGRSDLKMPEKWPELSRKLQRNPSSRELANYISELFGDAEATQRALTTLTSANAAAVNRIQALKALTAQQNPVLSTKLTQLYTDDVLREEVIRSMAAFDQEIFGRHLIRAYGQMNDSEKALALQTLSSRPRYGNLLMEEIKTGRIPKREIPASVARQMLRVVGSGFIEIWGPIEEVAYDEAAYAKYRGYLSAESLQNADLKKGKRLFQQSCGACHKMFGEGGELGPDLTGSNRTDVNYILLNVLEPSAEIQDAYKMVVITTRDGRTYTGNIIAETHRHLTLRVVGQDPVILNKSAIQSRETTDVSMMPSGLFEHLSEAEVVNLVAYLQTQRVID